MSQISAQCVPKVENFNLDFSSVYLTHFTKIKASIAKLDQLSGFKRTADQIDELTQDFFTKVWAENLLNQFDSARAKSKDAVLAFLYNHLRNFYSSKRTKEMLDAETKKQLKEIAKINSHAGFEESKGFCHDIKKVSKAFIKSLRGLEHKAWKFFIYDEASADEVAKQLGISNRTSFRLKDSIKSKAKRYLKRYYAGNYNFN